MGMLRPPTHYIRLAHSPLEMIIRGGSKAAVFHRLKEGHPEFLTFCKNFQFEGQGQRPTPVVDARGLVTLLNLLPGHKAAAFRAKSADIIVRYLGGDPTLIAEINRNAEIQANSLTTAPNTVSKVAPCSQVSGLPGRSITVAVLLLFSIIIINILIEIKQG